MGCNTSRLDRLPAVALCRDRCKFIDEALRESYALADAHVAHMESLKTLGPALLCFFDQFEDSGSAEETTNPQKINEAKSPPLPHSSSSSSSDSDAHVPLHSDSEPEDAEKDFQLRHRHYDYLHHDTVSHAPDNVAFLNYVQPLYAPFSPPLSNGGGYSLSKPPSPPPPTSSAWDFLNFFEPYEKYQVPYCHNASGGDNTTDSTTVEKEKGKVHINGHETQKSDGVGVDGSKSNGGEGKVNEGKNGEAKKNKEAGLKEKNSMPPESEECSNSAKAKSAKGFSEAVKEILILLERASASGNPILEMLDVGKLRYHRKIDFNPGSPITTYLMTQFSFFSFLISEIFYSIY